MVTWNAPDCLGPEARMTLTLQTAIARYGAQAKAKLHNVAVVGEPEDQLRAPIEGLIGDLAALSGFPQDAVKAVGESAIATLKTRPDYAITLRNVLVGFIEIKAPGKGADPHKFRGHDKEQWEKLQSLPNLLYTDGNQFGLFRGGRLEGTVVSLQGDIETSGSSLEAPPGLLALFGRLFPLGAHPAYQREGTGERCGPPLPIAPRRGRRTTGPRKSGTDGAGRRLAEAALPRGRQRPVRRWLRAGRDVRLAHGGQRGKSNWALVWIKPPRNSDRRTR